jgi:hypothetical protein
MLVHTCNPSTWEAEARRMESLGPAWATEPDINSKIADLDSCLKKIENKHMKR